MNPRTEIRGSIRRAKISLLGARQALLEGLQDEDCILTPADMREMTPELRDMTRLLSDVKKLSGKFREVADARTALV